MQIKNIIQLPEETVARLTGLLPFFREVKKRDQWQYNLLLQHSRVVTYGAQDVILEAGTWGHWLCFLVKGQLSVLAGSDKQHVNAITPGEVFGDLAMILGGGRHATVMVAKNCREAVVFEVDFSIFGALQDTHVVSLETKLIYFRNLLLGLRWKLEEYRIKYPGHELSNAHRAIKLYSGVTGTMDELIHLDQQAKQLGEFMLQWNQNFGRLAPLPEVVSATELLAEMPL